MSSTLQRKYYHEIMTPLKTSMFRLTHSILSPIATELSGWPVLNASPCTRNVMHRNIATSIPCEFCVCHFSMLFQIIDMFMVATVYWSTLYSPVWLLFIVTAGQTNEPFSANRCNALHNAKRRVDINKF